MQKRRLLALVAIIVIAITVSSAYAQTPTPKLSDSQVNLVIIAAISGVIVAPFVGFSTQENTSTTPADKFNWRQYGLALITGIPAVTALLLGEITGLHAQVEGYIGNILLFLMAFTQGLGVDYLKSRIAQAAQNK